MNSIVTDDDIIKGKISPSSMTGKYGFLKLKIGMTGFDLDKAMAALNILAESGWVYREYVLSGKTCGFIVERK